MEILRIRKVVRNTILACLVIFMGWSVLHNGLKKYEQNHYSAPGEYVAIEEDRDKIHVYTKGAGEQTIVLLPGLGTSAPVLDFEPLINDLAKNFKVVVVEPFGYGWSDMTDRKRSVENIVEEIRLALQIAQIEGPYILMPHSVSGIYSMYYANQYPNEVESIIGIDPTLPQVAEYFNESTPKMPTFFSLLAPTGIARLAIQLGAIDILPVAEDGTYTKENLAITKRISAWKGYNKNVVDEANEIEKNIEKTKDLSFPSQLPVMIFMEEDQKKTSEGKSMKSFYEHQLNHLANNRLLALKGHHYLHWSNYKEMTQEIIKFTSLFSSN